MENNNLNKSKYNLYSYVLVIVSFFLVLFFTKDALYELKVNSNTKKDIQAQIDEVTSQLENINKIKEDIKSWKIDKSALDKYLVKYNENEITEFFYTYALKNPTETKIKSISLEKSSLNEFGFNEWLINLQSVFQSQEALLKFINYVNNSEKYNLYIHELNFPMGTITSPFQINIPVKVLFK